mmetsp:Transcript_12905/g.22317  ORF Transcript_12905/g.22317 Transcript_12905/m.22317 type:complete len:204 (+) Transcript_12905:985-1596(+)
MGRRLAKRKQSTFTRTASWRWFLYSRPTSNCSSCTSSASAPQPVATLITCCRVDDLWNEYTARRHTCNARFKNSISIPEFPLVPNGGFITTTSTESIRRAAHWEACPERMSIHRRSRGTPVVSAFCSATSKASASMSTPTTCLQPITREPMPSIPGPQPRSAILMSAQSFSMKNAAHRMSEATSADVGYCSNSFFGSANPRIS